MKLTIAGVMTVVLSGLALTLPAPVEAQISSFQHIVIVVQENRTPDNLFQGLCTTPNACSANPTQNRTTGQTPYNIQTSNWLNKKSNTGVTQPVPVELTADYGDAHTHTAFKQMCDLGSGTGACLMDGADDIGCTGQCPANPPFGYVDNSSGILNPYLALATQYGFANYMFETNQGPSYPAHQFLFGATSAPSKADDHKGTFASENGVKGFDIGGCAAEPGTAVQLITSDGVEQKGNEIFPCFEHLTVADILKQFGYSWRYYAPTAGDIWTAPNSIKHICRAKNQTCKGKEWAANVDLVPSDVLSDIGNCQLRNVSWVIPTGQNSDHARVNTGGGPAWVASIVNAVGNSACKDGATSYWNDTAIVILWDDWGGWYDHVPPTFLKAPEGGYQLGYRVPMIFVSAYTSQGYVGNNPVDFGSVIRFVESNFSIRKGILTFADARAKDALSHYFNLSNTPRSFQTIPAPHDAKYFLNDHSPPLPPDDD